MRDIPSVKTTGEQLKQPAEIEFLRRRNLVETALKRKRFFSTYQNNHSHKKRLFNDTIGLNFKYPYIEKESVTKPLKSRNFRRLLHSFNIFCDQSIVFEGKNKDKMANQNELINNFLSGNDNQKDSNDVKSSHLNDENIKNHINNNTNHSNKNNSGDLNLNNNSSSMRYDNFDIERQGPPQRFPTSNPNSILPSASYIPQYTLIDNRIPFPIQEVVPNTQVPMTTGLEVNNFNDSTAAGLRARAPTVSANVLNVGDLYEGNNNIINGNFTDMRSNINTVNNENRTNNTESKISHRESMVGGIDEPMNVPLMVKPKTLHQNPQTPTVLPSTYHPINKWSSIKQSYLKEFLAEFLGTLVMILLGDAVCCQVNLGGASQQLKYVQALNNMKGTVSEDTLEVAKTLQDIVSSVSAGTFDDIPLGWAAAVVMGYFCSGGSAISGGHLNPSITISNWVFRGFPTKKVPLYLAGQVLGGFAGGLICFIFYKKVITEVYPDTWRTSQAVANNFVTVPKPYLSSARQFVSEYIATAVLQACIFAMTDPYTCLSTDVFPLMLFILIFSLNASLGLTTGCALNLARDLGPRLALYAVGFDRKLLWIYNKHYFWVPMTAPIIGALTGSLIYDICIYQGHESPVNWPLTVYKEKLLRLWMRRPGWATRTRNRATSELSEFSYNDDGDDGYGSEQISKGGYDSNTSSNGGILKKTRGKVKTKTKSQNSDDEFDGDYVQKNVTFKSVLKDKRNYGGISPIYEEGNGSDSSSSFDNDYEDDNGTSKIKEDRESMASSSDSSSLPKFTTRNPQ